MNFIFNIKIIRLTHNFWPQTDFLVDNALDVSQNFDNFFSMFIYNLKQR